MAPTSAETRDRAFLFHNSYSSFYRPPLKDLVPFAFRFFQFNLTSCRIYKLEDDGSKRLVPTFFAFRFFKGMRRLH